MYSINSYFLVQCLVNQHVQNVLHLCGAWQNQLSRKCCSISWKKFNVWYRLLSMFYWKANSIKTYKRVAIVLRKKVSGKTSIQTQFNLYGNCHSKTLQPHVKLLLTVSQRRKLLVRQCTHSSIPFTYQSTSATSASQYYKNIHRPTIP